MGRLHRLAARPAEVILPGTRADGYRLAEELRPSDRLEIETNARATGRLRPGWTVEGDLLTGLDTSPGHWSVWKGDTLLALCGVRRVPGRYENNRPAGVIWLLGTAAMDREWRAVTRAVRPWLAMQRREYGWLGNLVPAHMERRIAWLRYLGFDRWDGIAEGPLSRHVVFWSQS